MNGQSKNIAIVIASSLLVGIFVPFTIIKLMNDGNEEKLEDKYDPTTEELRDFAAMHVEYTASEDMQTIIEIAMREYATEDLPPEVVREALERNIHIEKMDHATIAGTGDIFTIRRKVYIGDDRLDHTVKIEYLGGDPAVMKNWRRLDPIRSSH